MPSVSASRTKNIFQGRVKSIATFITDLSKTTASCKQRVESCMASTTPPSKWFPKCASTKSFATLVNGISDFVQSQQQETLIAMAESFTTKVEAAKDVLDDLPDPCEQTTKFLRMLSAKKCAKTGKLVGLCSDLSERKKTLEYARKEMDSLATAWVISDKESESVWTLASRSSIEIEEHCESVAFLNAMLAVMKNPQVSTPAGAALREGLNNVYQTFCHRPELLIPPQWLDEAELLLGSFDSFKESMCVFVSVSECAATVH